jgi:phytanoyl-CoA hydroxylase
VFGAPRNLIPSELRDAHASFWRDGYVRLPSMLDDDSAIALGDRIRQIMAGAVDPAPFFFQHDSPSGLYQDLNYGSGYCGPSNAYRKIEKLERDPLLRRWIDHPSLAPLVQTLANSDVAAAPQPVALYRAVAWNKAAGGGTNLPWHQDGGLFWGIDRPGTVQLWTALDDAPEQAGCVEVVPGSHKAGLATPQGGTIPDHVAGPRESWAVALPAKRGDVIALHNYIWHRSGYNRSTAPRLAVSVSYLDAATQCTRQRYKPRTFLRMFET